MLTACGSGGSNGPGGERNAPDSIAVLAESSLKEAFTKIAQQLEGVNAGKTAHHTERATPSGRHRAGDTERAHRSADLVDVAAGGVLDGVLLPGGRRVGDV